MTDDARIEEAAKRLAAGWGYRARGDWTALPEVKKQLFRDGARAVLDAEAPVIPHQGRVR